MAATLKDVAELAGVSIATVSRVLNNPEKVAAQSRNRVLEAVDRLDPELEALGYQCMGEFGIPGRRYFRKGGDHRTHQLHVFQAGDRKNILRHLAVRDYLRACPAEREAYGALKRWLAGQYPEDIEGYCDGKDAFVRALERRALDWYDEKRP